MSMGAVNVCVRVCVRCTESSESFRGSPNGPKSGSSESELLNVEVAEVVRVHKRVHFVLLLSVRGHLHLTATHGDTERGHHQHKEEEQERALHRRRRSRGGGRGRWG